MAIRIFIYILLCICILSFLTTSIYTPKKVAKNKRIANIVFKNYTSCEIDAKGVTKSMKASAAYHYKNMDELYNATIILKTFKNNNSASDIISANYIKITRDYFHFKGDVKYKRSSGAYLQSKELKYNRKEKKLIGHHKFKANYKGTQFQGSSLSIKNDRTIFRSKDNVPLKLDLIINKERNK